MRSPTMAISSARRPKRSLMPVSMLGSGYSTIATFAIMLVFLLVRPQGIAGSNIQEKA